MTFEVDLIGFPDWAIPMCRVVPIFSSESGVDIDSQGLTLSTQFNYWFKKVDNANYILKVFVSGSLEDNDDNKFPLFVDIDLYILNQRLYDPIQKNRV